MILNNKSIEALKKNKEKIIELIIDGIDYDELPTDDHVVSFAQDFFYQLLQKNHVTIVFPKHIPTPEFLILLHHIELFSTQVSVDVFFDLHFFNNFNNIEKDLVEDLSSKLTKAKKITFPSKIILNNIFFKALCEGLKEHPSISLNFSYENMSEEDRRCCTNRIRILKFLIKEVNFLGAPAQDDFTKDPMFYCNSHDSQSPEEDYVLSTHPSSKPFPRGSELLFIHPVPSTHLREEHTERKKVIINIPLFFSGCWSLDVTLLTTLKIIASEFETYFLSDNGLIPMDPLTACPKKDSKSSVIFLTESAMRQKIKTIYPLNQVLLLNYETLYSFYTTDKIIRFNLSKLFENELSLEKLQFIRKTFNFSPIHSMALESFDEEHNEELTEPKYKKLLAEILLSSSVTELEITTNFYTVVDIFKPILKSKKIKTLNLLFKDDENDNDFESLFDNLFVPNLRLTLELNSLTGFYIPQHIANSLTFLQVGAVTNFGELDFDFLNHAHQLKELRFIMTSVDFSKWRKINGAIKLTTCSFIGMNKLPNMSENVWAEFKLILDSNAIILFNDNPYSVNDFEKKLFQRQKIPHYFSHKSMQKVTIGQERKLPANMMQYKNNQVTYVTPANYRTNTIDTIKGIQGQITYSLTTFPKNPHPVTLFPQPKDDYYVVEGSFKPGQALPDLGPNSRICFVESKNPITLVRHPVTLQIFVSLAEPKPVHLRYGFYIKPTNSPRNAGLIIDPTIISLFNNVIAATFDSRFQSNWLKTFPRFTTTVLLLRSSTKEPENQWGVIKHYCQASDSQHAAADFSGFLADRTPSQIDWSSLVPEKLLLELQASADIQNLIQATVSQTGVCIDAMFAVVLFLNCEFVRSFRAYQCSHNDYHAFVSADPAGRGWEDFMIGGPYCNDKIIPADFDVNDDKIVPADSDVKQTPVSQAVISPPTTSSNFIMKIHNDKTSFIPAKFYRKFVVQHIKIGPTDIQFPLAKPGRLATYPSCQSIPPNTPIYSVKGTFNPNEPLPDLGPNSFFIEAKSSQPFTIEIDINTNQAILTAQTPTFLHYSFFQLESSHATEGYPLIIDKKILSILAKLIAQTKQKRFAENWVSTFPRFINFLADLTSVKDKKEKIWAYIQNYCQTCETLDVPADYSGFYNNRIFPQVYWESLISEDLKQEIVNTPALRLLVPSIIGQRGDRKIAALTASLFCRRSKIRFQLIYNETGLILFADPSTNRWVPLDISSLDPQSEYKHSSGSTPLVFPSVPYVSSPSVHTHPRISSSLTVLSDVTPAILPVLAHPPLPAIQPALPSTPAQQRLSQAHLQPALPSALVTAQQPALPSTPAQQRVSQAHLQPALPSALVTAQQPALPSTPAQQQVSPKTPLQPALAEIKTQRPPLTKLFATPHLPYRRYVHWSDTCTDLKVAVTHLTAYTKERAPLVPVPTPTAAIGLSHILIASQDPMIDNYFINHPMQWESLLTKTTINADGNLEPHLGPLKKSIETGRKIRLVINLDAFRVHDYSILLAILDDFKPLLQDYPLPNRLNCRIILIASERAFRSIREDLSGRTQLTQLSLLNTQFQSIGDQIQLQQLPTVEEKSDSHNVINFDKQPELLDSLLSGHYGLDQKGVHYVPAFWEDKEFKRPVVFSNVPTLEECLKNHTLQYKLVTGAFDKLSLFLSKNPSSILTPKMIKDNKELTQLIDKKPAQLWLDEDNYSGFVISLQIKGSQIITHAQGPAIHALKTHHCLLIWVSPDLAEWKIRQCWQQLLQSHPELANRIHWVAYNPNTAQSLRHKKNIHLADKPFETLSKLIEQKQLPGHVEVVPICNDVKTCDSMALMEKIVRIPAKDSKSLPSWKLETQYVLDCLQKGKPVVLVGEISQSLLRSLKTIFLLGYYWSFSGEFVPLKAPLWLITSRIPYPLDSSLITKHSASLPIIPQAPLPLVTQAIGVLDEASYREAKKIFLTRLKNHLKKYFIAALENPASSLSTFTWIKWLEKELTIPIFTSVEAWLAAPKGLLVVTPEYSNRVRFNAYTCGDVRYEGHTQTLSSKKLVVWTTAKHPEGVLVFRSMPLTQGLIEAEYIRPLAEELKFTPKDAKAMLAIVLAGYQWLLQQPCNARYQFSCDEISAAIARFKLYHHKKQEDETPAALMVNACCLQFYTWITPQSPKDQINLVKQLRKVLESAVPHEKKATPSLLFSQAPTQQLREHGYFINEKIESQIHFCSEFFRAQEIKINNGKKILLLQGSPGVGKTFLIQHWLEINKKKHLRISVMYEGLTPTIRAQIEKLSQTDGWLVIEELNCLSEEDQHWLANLINHPDTNPSFRLIGTANDTDQGRRDLITRLYSLVEVHYVHEYTRKELLEIALEKNFPHAGLLGAAFFALLEYERSSPSSQRVMTTMRSYFELLNYFSSPECNHDGWGKIPAGEFLATILFPLLIKFCSSLHFEQDACWNAIKKDKLILRIISEYERKPSTPKEVTEPPSKKAKIG